MTGIYWYSETSNTFKNNIKLLYFITKIANQDDYNAYI